MGRASKDVIPIFRSAFQGPEDEFNQDLGIRPVVFDILAPDRETSILPEGLKMVLHVNPTSMSFSYEKLVERIQTKGGHVEQHWGDGTRSISFSMVTGGFKRLFTGLSHITGGGLDVGGTRRETIAYDKYLDLLALFHNNGSVYDTRGQIVFQGIIKITFDGGIYFGWFNSFSVNELAEKPFQFELTAEFMVSHEIVRFRSFLTPTPDFTVDAIKWPVTDAQRDAQRAVTAPKAPPITPKKPQDSGVPKAPKPETPTNPTLPGPTVPWSGASGQIDPGLSPYKTPPPAPVPTTPKPVPTPTPAPPLKKTSPGWQTPDLDTDDDGILDTYDPADELDLEEEGILDVYTPEDSR